MEFISGESRNQITLLPDSIDDYVDGNNPVRVIDAYINSVDLAALGFSHAQPNDTGRPRFDPTDLSKLYLYGYMNRTRSSRRLETETKRNLEVMWLLKRLSPDHKTIARFRHDNAAALKNLFRDFVKLCTKLELYGKELIAIDGSKFKAVNSKERNFNDKKLRERIERIDTKIEEYLRLLEENDAQEDAVPGGKSAEEIGQIINALVQRKDCYQAYMQELEETGELQKSVTDADSRLMMANGKLDVCYNVQSAVDSKNNMIVDFKVTNCAVDKNQLMPMIASAGEALKTDALEAVADVGYDSVQDIVDCMEHGAKVHVAGTDFDVCLPSNSSMEKIESHTKGRCVYFADRNIVLCPMGEILYPKFYKKSKGMGVFANYAACAVCPCKCTTERYKRHQVSMKASDFKKKYNDRDLSVQQVRIAPDKEIIRQRKSIVEHPFGTIKRTMEAGYCLMKGLAHVNGEFSLTFLAYNFKRAINIMGVGKLMEAIGA